MWELLIHSIIWVWAAINVWVSFHPKSKLQSLSVVGINPLLVAAGIQAGAGLASRFLGPRPSPPDIFTPAVREAERSRSRILELLEQQSGDLESVLAARGATGSGGAGDREALIRAASGAVSDIDASLADIITDAGNRQRELEFQDRLSRFQSRQQGLAQLANVGSSLFSLSQLTNAPTQTIEASAGPSPQQIDLLNIAAQSSRTLPENFEIEALTPRVNPLTGLVDFGG
jgi:hypothetical protein